MSKSGGGEHIDDMLDCFVGAVVGQFELTVWAVAVSERPAQTFVEE